MLDPACGSGAFLIAAYDRLLREYASVNASLATLSGVSEQQLDIHDLDKAILQGNLFGVDINRESVEITKLSLWLKTASYGKKLTDLDRNIRRGNSVVGDKQVDPLAFDWTLGEIAYDVTGGETARDEDEGRVDEAREAARADEPVATAAAATPPAAPHDARRRARPATPELVGPDDPFRVRRLPWAILLKRTWGFSVLVCPRCAGPRRSDPRRRRTDSGPAAAGAPRRCHRGPSGDSPANRISGGLWPRRSSRT